MKYSEEEIRRAVGNAHWKYRNGVPDCPGLDDLVLIELNRPKLKDDCPCIDSGGNVWNGPPSFRDDCIALVRADRVMEWARDTQRMIEDDYIDVDVVRYIASRIAEETEVHDE